MQRDDVGGAIFGRCVDDRLAHGMEFIFGRSICTCTCGDLARLLEAGIEGRIPHP